MRTVIAVTALMTPVWLAAQEKQERKQWTEEDLGKHLGKEWYDLGSMKIDDTTAGLYLREYEKVYQVGFSISGPAEYLNTLGGSRFRMWVLTKARGSLPLLDRPDDKFLGWAGKAQGGTANANFMFRHDGERDHLAGIVASIDGKLQVFPMVPR